MPNMVDVDALIESGADVFTDSMQASSTRLTFSIPSNLSGGNTILALNSSNSIVAGTVVSAILLNGIPYIYSVSNNGESTERDSGSITFGDGILVFSVATVDSAFRGTYTMVLWKV